MPDADGLSPARPPALVELRGLERRFGDRMVLAGLDLEIAPGERLAIVGPSGSGKSTLLGLIAGLGAPDAGAIWIAGILASRLGRILVPPNARGIGFVFQSAALWPHLSAAGNIAFALDGRRPKLDRGARDRRVAELLDEVGLAGMGARYPDQLSGGEARRVALARALAVAPRLLLLDEPVTNVDAARKAQLLELIVRSAEHSGAALVMVTHDMGEAAAVADRRLRIEGGRLEAD